MPVPITKTVALRHKDTLTHGGSSMVLIVKLWGFDEGCVGARAIVEDFYCGRGYFVGGHGKDLLGLIYINMILFLRTRV
jgi:hypothetical protein